MNDVIFCGNTPEDNMRMREYFNSLPAYVQETVQQCGIEFCTVEELKKCAQNMTQEQ